MPSHFTGSHPLRSQLHQEASTQGPAHPPAQGHLGAFNLRQTLSDCGGGFDPRQGRRLSSYSHSTGEDTEAWSRSELVQSPDWEAEELGFETSTLAVAVPKRWAGGR